MLRIAALVFGVAADVVAGVQVRSGKAYDHLLDKDIARSLAKIACPICTFDNAESSKMCQACGSSVSCFTQKSESQNKSLSIRFILHLLHHSYDSYYIQYCNLSLQN